VLPVRRYSGQLSDKPLLAIEVNLHIDDFKVQSLLRCANFLLLRANSHFQVSRRQPPMEAGTVAFEEAEPLVTLSTSAVGAPITVGSNQALVSGGLQSFLDTYPIKWSSFKWLV
jgi:hypothetical protein